MNPPFQPIRFPTTVPATVPGGGWNPYTGPQEDGASLYANSGAVRYNGQNQTSQINTAKPMPAWELGPGPATPNISSLKPQGPIGNGYAPIPQGQVGIGVGNPSTPSPSVATAQVRFYLTPDGNLTILDNKTGQAFAVPPAGSVPRPPYYSPTRPT